MRASLLALALAALVVASACAGSAPARNEAAPDAARLYRTKCTACHRAYEPGSRRAEEWTAVLDRMAPKAKLTPAQREALLTWLRAQASDAPGTTKEPVQ